MSSILDEAYVRLRGTGPEWGDALSGHLDAAAALDAVPRIPTQQGFLASRFDQLGTLAAAIRVGQVIG
jgi:hypothetical protein